MNHKCSLCTKSFIKKGNLDRHISMNHNNKNYECKYCNKNYLHHQSLYRHMKTCKKIEINNDSNKIVEYKPNDVLDDVKDVLKKNNLSNEQYKNIMNILETELVTSNKNVVINIQNNITNNNTQVTNNIDKFHMDVFLNQTCKDAINMSDFMKSIQPTYNDIQNCGQDGIVTTISNTVVSRLKDLELEKRPIHCSDKKRKTLYIKDNDNWNKDINHDLIRRIIDEISYKQVRALQEWMSTTHEQMSSDEYTNKLMEITRSLTDDLSLNRCYTKIIGNISESIYI
jgi:Zinc finger, C2H2 type